MTVLAWMLSFGSVLRMTFGLVPACSFLLRPAPLALYIPPSSVPCPMPLLLALSLVPGQTRSQLTWLFSCSPSVSPFSLSSVLSLSLPLSLSSSSLAPSVAICLTSLLLAVTLVPGHVCSRMILLTSCSPSVLLLSLEVSFRSSLTLLVAFFFFLAHSLDMPKWPLSPQVLHVLSSAGHFCPDLCLSYVHLGH